jgi:ElaB/YqjD/DUF883 family membrane-anchored ribosome-binding protein
MKNKSSTVHRNAGASGHDSDELLAATSAAVEGLADDARALISATAHVAEEGVVEARKRLANALEKCRSAWETAQEVAVEKAQLADESIRKHPYRAMGIAFGVGTLIGILIRRK